MESAVQKRHLSVPVMWAILFAALGMANIWIGQSKRLYYAEAVSKRTPKSEMSADRSSLHRRRLRSRIDYYSLVYNGGICFLAVSAVLFGVAVVGPLRSRTPVERTDSDSAEEDQ